MIIYGKLISETIIKILKANYGSNYIPISEDLTEELFTAIDTFSGQTEGLYDSKIIPQFETALVSYVVGKNF